MSESLDAVISDLDESRSIRLDELRCRLGSEEDARQAWAWLAAGHVSTNPPFLGNDRFELDVMVDSGATASVWQAYDRKLSRHVAIKIFHDSVRGWIELGLREARAASEVISEHVVRVHDVHDAAPPYIVLELVAEHEPGHPLRLGASAATVEPRDLDEAVRWVRDVGRGVHQAHLHGVFHRDLKPQNVLITPISRRAKIADFGLATSMSEITVGDGPQISGTPEYVAPEQARDALQGTPRHRERTALTAIDVWGLGAIAYELIGGTPPWTARSDFGSWEFAASGCPPTPLSRTRWGRSVPTRLRKIIERSLAMTPDLRYASARSMVDELDAYLGRRPTSFDRNPATRMHLWARRNPQLSIVALVALVLGGMSLAAYSTVAELRSERQELSWDIQRAEAQRHSLELQTQRIRHDLRQNDDSLREKTAALMSLQRTLADTRADYDAVVAAKIRELQNAGLVTRELQAEISGAHSDVGAAEKGRELYEQFWLRAREETQRATDERDLARRERDSARRERDQIVGERDKAKAALASVESERNALRTERDRLQQGRAREKELERVEATLSGLRSQLTRVAPENSGVAKGAVN